MGDRNRWGPVICTCAAVATAILFAVPSSNADEATNPVSVSWKPEQPPSHPASRVDQAMAYYPDAGTTLLFGGRTQTGIVADTWTWDGATWTARSPSSTPPARTGAGLAYDDVGHRLILFGGSSGTTALNDTWAWDGSSGWTLLSPAHSPAGRDRAMLAQDPAGGIVLYAPATTTDPDMWHWSGTDWEPLSPPCCGPSGYIVDMAYSAGLDKTVALVHPIFEHLAQTWLWDGATWTFVDTPKPDVSSGGALAYSAQLQALVLFAASPSLPNAQTGNTVYRMDGLSWRYEPTVDRPAIRYPRQGGFAQGPGGEGVMFGGTVEAGGAGLFGDTWTVGGTFQSTEALGGALVGGPAAAAWAPGRLDVFVRGTDNGLWHRGFAGGWSSWENLGGGLTEEPAVAAWAPGRLDVFVRGTDNALWHRWFAGGWSGWESLGGTLDSAPAVAAWGSNRLDVFARGTDGAMWHRWWDGAAWRGWESLAGSLTSKPAVSAWGANRLDVFVKGNDNAIWHKWWDGSAWRGYESLGGAFSSAPAAASRQPGSIDLFGSALGAVWQGGFRGTWTAPPYVRVLEDAGSALAVTSGVPGRFDVFVRSGSGELRHAVSR
jgi:hypothetical protein